MKRLRAAGMIGALVLIVGSPALASPHQTDGTAAERAKANEHAHHPPKKTARAEGELAQMKLRADHIQRWLRGARAEHDALRSHCLDGKLSQAHATERQARSTVAQLKASDGRARTAWRLRLDIIAERSRALLAAARACGRTVSKRVRMPTKTRVRVITPPLPAPPDGDIGDAFRMPSGSTSSLKAR